MNKKNSRPKETVELRRRAEELAREKAPRIPENLSAQSPEEARRILHELRVHQIELEMQNEELRRTQVELDSAWARYFDLYNLAPVGYITLNKQGLILDANLTAATLLNVARGPLVRQPITRFIRKEDQDSYYLYHKQLFETGALSSCELRMVKENGVTFWARLEATGTPEVDGTPLCRVVISDIAEQKRAEEAREKLEAQNRQLLKSESLSRMAGAIAHHLNNQLMVMIGALDLSMRDPLPARMSRMLTKAMTAALKATEVSDLMLTYLGQTMPTQEPMDICEVCNQNLPLLRAVLPKRIRLVTIFPFPGPRVYGNARQIQQILANLITNAQEAIGEGTGAIELTIKTVSATEILCAFCYPNDWRPLDATYACLEIRDPGCGIEEKDVEKIFDPFYTNKFTGRGMGLPVVVGILRAHRGAITAESQPNRGSIFKIFLPILTECRPNGGDRLDFIPK